MEKITEYLNQFSVLGHDSDLNCDTLSQMLYSAILNKFKITMDHEEYKYFKEYQERVFNLVENLRELDINMIKEVLEFLDKENPYLADITIMFWSMPRTDNFLSKKFYNDEYRENIAKYNKKLVEIIDHHVIKNFCVETLSKTNSVPIHCIDLLWYYMNNLSFEFAFYNTESAAYIGFIMPEHNDFIEFGFNMEYLLDLGLGQVEYKNDPYSKGTFRSFLKKFVTDLDVIKMMLTIKTKQNYFKQLININKNLAKYFGEKMDPISEDLMNEFSKMVKVC